MNRIHKLTLHDFDMIEMDGKLIGIEPNPIAIANAIQILIDKINELIEEANGLMDINKL
jgi:hypothetical protein